MTYDFTSITEVSLAEGAHKSASDGLCFMEMVAWFAGEEHSDQPACVCPVLEAYGIRLNDGMPDNLRDELLKPLVPLIVGTRGTLADQIARATFLADWARDKIVPLAAGNAAASAYVSAYAKAAAATNAAANAAANANVDAKAADAKAGYAAYAAGYAVANTAGAADPRLVYATAVEGLRQAILIGPHEGIPATVDIAARHEALRALVSA